MIEEHARVLAVDSERVTLVVDRRSTCGQCASGAGCGTSLLSAWINRRQVTLTIPRQPDVSVDVGDLVVLGLDERAVQRSAILLYATPLAGLLAGALSGQFVASSTGFSSELASILLGLFGLAAALAWINRREGDIGREHAHRIRIVRLVPSKIRSPEVNMTSLVQRTRRGLHSE